MAQALATVKQQIRTHRAELEKALPEHVRFERFERVLGSALARNQDLLSCDRASLFTAISQCAADGLMPDGREAALVKFSTQVAYMPMVEGLLKLARQSGEIASIAANVVYDGDKFEYWVDETGEHMEHRPTFGRKKGAIVATYAMARTKDGEAIIQVMDTDDIEQIRKVSRNRDKGPWKDWYAQMAIKSAIRRLFKRLPKSTDRFEQAVHRDDQFYPFGEQVAPESVPSADASAAAFLAPADAMTPVDAKDVPEAGAADAADAKQANDVGQTSDDEAVF